VPYRKAAVVLCSDLVVAQQHEDAKVNGEPMLRFVCFDEGAKTALDRPLQREEDRLDDNLVYLCVHDGCYRDSVKIGALGVKEGVRVIQNMTQRFVAFDPPRFLDETACNPEFDYFAEKFLCGFVLKSQSRLKGEMATRTAEAHLGSFGALHDHRKCLAENRCSV
jgi:hypothetical protein